MDTEVVTIEIAKLQLSEGDMLVFKIPQFDPGDTRRYLDILEPVIPDGVEVLFADKVVDLEVYSPSDRIEMMEERVDRLEVKVRKLSWGTTG